MTRQRIIVLGLDPGSRITGFGVLSIDRARRSQPAHCLSCGHIRAGSDAMHLRLARIKSGIDELVAEFQPDVVAIERIFMNKHADAALKLGQARGVAIVAATAAGAALFEYAPNAVKQAAVGKGHADKSQVQHMMKALLNLADTPPPDAADALAVALCHTHHHLAGSTDATSGGMPSAVDEVSS